MFTHETSDDVDSMNSQTSQIRLLAFASGRVFIYNPAIRMGKTIELNDGL